MLICALQTKPDNDYSKLLYNTKIYNSNNSISILWLARKENYYQNVLKKSFYYKYLLTRLKLD